MPGQQDRIGGQNAAFVLHRRLFAWIRSTERLLDLKHGGGLHDVFHAPGIVDARKLHQNLVLPEAMLLDGRLADAERVNAVADGVDRLRNRLILQIGQAA